MKLLSLILTVAAVFAMVAQPVIAQDEEARPAVDRQAQMLKRMGDTNEDGKISKEEYVAAAEARFDALDTDGDGALTTEELRAGRRGRAGREGAVGGQGGQGGRQRGQRGGRGGGGAGGGEG